MKLLGDGVCDDELNAERYNYDNWDCCSAQASRDVCEDCFCKAEVLNIPKPKGIK